MDWEELKMGTDDSWNSLAYRHITVGAKLSLELPNNMGLHVAAHKVVWVQNGPDDMVDVSVGVHHWIPELSSR